MNNILKVAAVQMNPKLLKNDKNLEKMLLGIQEAAAEGAELIVFPECALTGYWYNSRDEAMAHSETIPDSATNGVANLCKELGVYVIFGLLEMDNDRLFNAAAFVGPDSIVGVYRKTHIAPAGVDRFIDRGDESFKVYRTPIGNIGILICHDITFPEPARVLMLQGADVIIVPTNWPRRYDIVSKHIINTRAVENFVHIIAADRVGREREHKYLGLSKIVNARGMTKVSAGIRSEEILHCELDLAFARRKSFPGVINIINDRRVEFYGDIARPDAYQPVG